MTLAVLFLLAALATASASEKPKNQRCRSTGFSSGSP